MSGSRLVADAGGTNVRFAIASADGRLERVRTYQVEDHPTFSDALAAYRGDAGGHLDVDSAAIAAAGPVDNGSCKLTNNAWSVVREEIAALLGGVPVVVLNDLEAVASALPHLAPADVHQLGGPSPVWPEQRTMLAVNVGTGFGAASIMRREGRWWTCPSEAGHMTFGRVLADEAEWLPIAASVESVLSGHGLALLHARLIGAGDRAVLETADVLARAAHDPMAARALQVFTTALGRIAGDLALATCAWGGVYLCGSVAVGWSAMADSELFRAEFTRKGPMRARMLAVPSVVIRRENAALFGLARIHVTP
jgi:glucokinase